LAVSCVKEVTRQYNEARVITDIGTISLGMQKQHISHILSSSISTPHYHLSSAMPGKHVHFLPTPKAYAPLTPSTPALSVGASPLSSSGPRTPPAFARGLPGPSPYAVPYGVKTRPTAPRTVRLHTFLQFSQSPTLNWDVSLPPSTISTRHRELSRHTLAEPATSPPLSRITLRSPHMPWNITVSATRDGCVTVGDVLDTIYRTLRANVSSREFHELPSAKDSRRVTAAYEQRYRRHNRSKGYESEKQGGLRRVDFLMGHNIFTGFSPTTRGPDVWALNTS